MDNADATAGGAAVAGTGPDWSFQDRAVEQIEGAYANGHRSVLLVSPTGSGKTVMVRKLIDRYRANGGGAVLFAAHRREIILQTCAKLTAAGIHHGVIQAGLEHLIRPYAPVQVAAIATLASRALQRKTMPLPPAALLVIDEAHHGVAPTYRKVVDAYRDALLLGATATPVRGDGRGLGGIFETMVCCPQVKELVGLGVLVTARVLAPEAMQPDLRGVGVVAGEYNEGQLAERMDDAKLVGDICTQYQKHGKGRKAMLFATSVAHSIHCCNELNKSGVRAAHIDGTTPKDLRDEIIERLRQGELDVLCNNLVFTEGFDLPDVSCIILARPTRRLLTYLQMLGRGLRAFPGKKDCMVLDHSGAVYLHGRPDDDFEWSLDPDIKVASKAHAARKRATNKEHQGGLLECTAIVDGEKCGTLRVGGQPCWAFTEASCGICKSGRRRLGPVRHVCDEAPSSRYRPLAGDDAVDCERPELQARLGLLQDWRKVQDTSALAHEPGADAAVARGLILGAVAADCLREDDGEEEGVRVMAEHEPCIGATSEWFTPPEIFDALGLVFDLDPCSPGAGHWVPARKVYTVDDDGLRQPWRGLVFMNPPFGGRNGHVPWLVKFLEHANGIAIVRAYTSSGWFHKHVVPRAELLLFPRGKTKFVRPDGSVGGAPGHGVVLLGMGDVANDALRHSGLGFCARVLPCLAAQEGGRHARRPPKCEDCGENYADLPAKLCPGCEAYREHQR